MEEIELTSEMGEEVMEVVEEIEENYDEEV